MASTQSVGSTTRAQAMGWRTFRVKRASDPVLPNEVVCPAAKEAGEVRTCVTCHACKGYTRPVQCHIVLDGHASGPVLVNVLKVLDAQAS